MLHREGDDDLDDLNGTKDREITLGTTMILGIFFALAVLCAVFFGFGYQLGRKSVVATPVAVTSQSPADASFAGSKPAAGSPAISAPDRTSGPTVTVPSGPEPTADSPAPRSAPPPAAADPDSEVVGDNPPPVPAPRPAAAIIPAAPVNATPAATGAGSIVQIAAVSHQEDADLLVSTLKRRGYNVAIHTEPQDKLLHVQIGPFPTHKDADAMRQKLLADGFNAIVKDNK
jgi:cell division septation protein DedD